MFQPQRDQYLEEAHAWRTSEELRNSLGDLSERGAREAWRERPTIMRAVVRCEDVAGHRSWDSEAGRVATRPRPPHWPRLAGLGACSQSQQRDPCKAPKW